MDKQTKNQLARELAQVTITVLAASTGAVFTDPALAVVAAPTAAGAGTLLSRLLDRFDLGQTGHNYIETAHSKLLDLAEQHSDEEVEMAFATALDAIKRFGLNARKFAILDFDAHKAAIEVARSSGYHNLWRENEREQPTLAFQCLEALYESYRDHQEHSDELERTFQDEVLARTQNLHSLSEELRPLAEALSGSSLLEMPTSRYYPDASPTTLLSSRYQILPYQSRVEDEAFGDWLEQDTGHPISIATVQAPGGSGKTRWLLEHCRHRDNLWRVGFLRNEDSLSVLATYQAMLSGPQKILVVVDYAEDRSEQIIRLLDASVRALDGGAQHLRIVLLSRNLTDQWWDNLRPQLSDRARGWVTKESRVLHPVDLKPLSPAIEDREAIFETAVDALCPHLTNPAAIPNLPDLSPPFYSNPLFVQLAALSLLRDGDAPLNDMALLEETLDHEAKYWVGDGVQRDQVEPILAVSTLWQGLNSGTLNALIEQWPDRTAAVADANPTKLAQRLRRLYPGENDGIAPLLPDRLGEAVILRALSRDPQSLAQVAFGPAVEDTHRQQAFSVLTRMPASAQARLAAIGRVLADLLRQHADTNFAMRLIAQLPEYSIGLAEVDEAAARMVREQLESHPQDTEYYRAQLARSLNYHSITLSSLRQPEASLDAVQESANLNRQLAAQRPDTFTLDLATSLTNLAIQLSALGRLEPALDAAQESTDLFRQLAAQRPDAFNPHLVASLINLAIQLAALDRREAALGTAQEAVKIQRQLAAQRPDTFNHDLAKSLNTLSTQLAALGGLEPALDVAQESTDLYRRLAAQQPDAFTPSLAGSLVNLANRFSAFGRREKALDAAQESTDLFRQLADQQPDIFTPDLAMSLTNLTIQLANLGRRETALDAAQESTDLYRRLAAQRPDAFNPDLAGSLANLTVQLAKLGHFEPALDVAQESTDLFRQLAAQRPDAFNPGLAASLTNLANRLSALGRLEPALGVAQESTDLFRQLATQRPDAFNPDLAGSLTNLTIQLAKLDRFEPALDVAQESTDLFRQLAAQQPDAFNPGLAGSLTNLAIQLAALDRLEPALGAAQESTDLFRQLATQQPDAFNPGLATSLHNLANRFSALGHFEPALDVAQESTDLFRQLAAQWLDTFNPDLATSLNTLANQFSALGHRKAAFDAQQEATDLFRRLNTEQRDPSRPIL